MTDRPYGKLSDGTPVGLFTLANARGMRAEIITSPDRNGQFADVVLGMDSLQGYLQQKAYFGALIGRYANRIGHGRFTLEGKLYELPRNEGENTLHGGTRGFDKHVWEPGKAITPDGEGLVLTLVSDDGDQGFPGNLLVRAVYVLTEANELKIEYTASTDKPTVVNLTNHSYFNLAGQGEGDILQHRVAINADRFTPIDAGMIPTGEVRNVRGTPLDFTKATAVGARIDDKDEQLQLARGYDHNWVLNTGEGLGKAAEVYEPQSGRVMEVWTTEPGLQFYSGNFLDGTIRGKAGKTYPFRGGFCMETQHFPDSPNKQNFPGTGLKPGVAYQSTTVYRFSAR